MFVLNRNITVYLHAAQATFYTKNHFQTVGLCAQVYDIHRYRHIPALVRGCSALPTPARLVMAIRSRPN